MADKYIAISGNAKVEVEATVTSAGAGNAGDIVALDSSGKLHETVMPVGIGADVAVIEASENLTDGDFVNIHDSTGAKVRKADASNGRRADGFVLANVTSGQDATVYFEGQNTSLTSLTVGSTYFLSGSVPGGVTATAPTTSTHLMQEVGRAVATTTLSVELGQPVTRA